MLRHGNVELVGLRSRNGQEQWLPYAYTEGQWRREDGVVLAEVDRVYVRQHGRFYMEVDPMTREVTDLRKVFTVTKIDGENVDV